MSMTCDTESGVTKAYASRRVTIALSAGANVTCTFANESPSITLIHDSTPEHAQDFAYTGCLGAGCTTFALDDDTDPALPNRVASSGLAIGTYTITQAPTAPWSLFSITCQGGSTTTDRPNRRVQITLHSATAHATCTFENVTQSVTIVDDDVADAGQDHQFTGCSSDGCSRFALDDDGGGDATLPDRLPSGPIPTGTYTITQDAAPPGHELTGLVCPNETIDLVAGRATVTLAAGEHRTCTFTNRPTPAALTGVAEVAPSVFATCARLTNGQARCWGWHLLGDGTGQDSDRPVVVSNVEGTGPLTGVRQIAGSWAHHCVLLEDGTAACWGATDDGEAERRPVVVTDSTGTAPLTGITQISAGIMRTCVRLDTGEARCWGQNHNGELGNQTTTDSGLPVTVLDTDGSPMDGIAQIVTGAEHTCVVLDSTEVRCWGANSRGQLGDKTNTASLAPVSAVVPDGSGVLTGVRSLSGFSHRATCALLFDARAVCWGPTPTGSSGGSSDDPRFVSNESGAEAMTDIVAISPGTNGTCFVTGDGTAWCMSQERALIGNGSLPTAGPFEQALPVRVIDRNTMGALTGVVDIGVGWDVACATLASGQARCWGRNIDGEVGDGTRFDRYWAAAVIAP